MQVQQGGRGAVAQAPQHHAPHLRLLRAQRVDGGRDVGGDGLEAALLAFAVAHAAHVETQHREARGRQLARQQDELPVAAAAVLRPADDDDDAQVGRRRRADADQLRACAGEDDRALGAGCGAGLRQGGDIHGRAVR